MRSDLAAFKERLDHASNMLQLAGHLPREALAGRLLDIGCGIGNGVVAAALQGASLAVGIDRDFAEFGHVFAIAEFPEICAHFGADPRKTLLIEADLFQTRFAPASFDCCIMIDSIEHVPEPQKFIDFAYQALAAGGYFLIDACPLYYSSQGHHLFAYFPVEAYPWVHLWSDFDDVLAARNVDPWSLDRYRELNKVTHDSIRAMMEQSGFDIVAEHRSEADDAKRAQLAQVRDRIRPECLGQEARLFEDWVRLVGVRRS